MQRKMYGGHLYTSFILWERERNKKSDVFIWILEDFYLYISSYQNSNK
jgi:hypothetical protein